VTTPDSFTIALVGTGLTGTLTAYLESPTGRVTGTVTSTVATAASVAFKNVPSGSYKLFLHSDSQGYATFTSDTERTFNIALGTIAAT
jgi:hypothetical protein